MKTVAWMAIENIAWCCAFLMCLFFLDGWWRLMCFVPLTMCNTKFTLK